MFLLSVVLGLHRRPSPHNRVQCELHGSICHNVAMAFVILQHLGREQVMQASPDRASALRELALPQISDHGVAARANAAKLEDRDVLEREPHGLAHEASLERAMRPVVIPPRRRGSRVPIP